MNAPVPCRVTADLRAYEASLPRELTEAELDEARNELVWEILDGKTRGGFDLEACLDCEANENEKFIRELAAFGRQSQSDERGTLAFDFQNWCEAIVAKHLPEELIDQRAAQIQADREEAAQCSE